MVKETMKSNKECRILGFEFFSLVKRVPVCLIHLQRIHVQRIENEKAVIQH